MSMPGEVLAHGVGGREDLPIPFPFALAGALAALLATFVVLGVAWRDSRFEGRAGRRRLPRRMSRVLDAPSFRWTLRVAGLVGACWLVGVLLLGPQDSRDNPGPRVLYVLMWVGLPLGSVLLGPLWRALNPLRTVHHAVARLTRTPPDGLARLPRALGYWPAVVTLAAFVWLELVPPDRAMPPVVLLALSIHAAVMLIGALVFGREWFARADPFEVYSTLAAQLAPFGRDRAGHLVVRNPFHGLAAIPASPGLTGVVLVLLGSTAFDSLSDSPRWLQLVQGNRSVTLLGTIGLVAAILLLTVAFLAVARVTAALGGGSRRIAARFAHSLLPIAIGYVLAHYYSLAVVEGQRTLILAAGSLVPGGNAFGLTRADVDLTLVPPTAVATVQVGAVVAGHVIGAIAAHDRAMHLFPPRRARIGQLPLLLLMVAYTYLGLTLLFAA
ncbi:hypothetical protein SAMN06265360_11322 [Haloechinothrix alba]|uniref:Fenitrothion hydrolase n=1 Tax=Haloechinothrix alba TaxID=664784 RepID=A0A238XZU0_9PSEU|nr:hypothetical protein [Haloechinothrix alba]SNR64566.1 hypothetical protein SAMN06265360_11322 [Haloechinothrix alba]